jgi:phenylpropionate dioxygenase-like ring-hydroxylating dioxygenase large terminal subunit
MLRASSLTARASPISGGRRRRHIACGFHAWTMVLELHERESACDQNFEIEQNTTCLGSSVRQGVLWYKKNLLLKKAN